MKKNIKEILNTNKIKSIIIFIALFILIVGILFCITSVEKNNEKILEDKINQEQELENIKIDEYNFEQLNIVKSVLNGLDKNSYSFNNLKQFNEKYNQDIKTIKYCYFLSDINGYFKNNHGGGFRFGFLLESDKYTEKYKEQYYMYPLYDLPTDTICFGLGDDGGCYEHNKQNFIKTISNPCRD